MNKLKIGNNLYQYVVPSPLSGYTDYPFRKVLKDCGADIVSTEMVSVESIVRNNPKADKLLYFDDYQRPVSIQLFGYSPISFAKAVEKILNNDIVPDFFDLNFGCSVRKILKSKGGSYLLTEPNTIVSIIREIKKVSDIPVTAKIRSGKDNNSLNFIEIGKIIQDNGGESVTLHPRTTKDLFKNFAQWKHIAELKKALNIPVIGNGDIKNEDDALRMFNETGCDAVMLGRSIMADPFMIKKIIYFIETGKKLNIKLTDFLNTVIMHLKYFNEFYGTQKIHCIRKFIVKYMKHFDIKKSFKEKLLNVTSFDELNVLLFSLNKVVD